MKLVFLKRCMNKACSNVEKASHNGLELLGDDLLSKYSSNMVTWCVTNKMQDGENSLHLWYIQVHLVYFDFA